MLSNRHLRYRLRSPRLPSGIKDTTPLLTSPTASLPTKRSGRSFALHLVLQLSGELDIHKFYASTRSLNPDSPFTANIYFPAIPVISKDFHKDVEFINLSVTMYMVMQGICTSWSYCITLCTLPVAFGVMI